VSSNPLIIPLEALTHQCDDPRLVQVLQLIAEVVPSCFLVGGAVRDCLLHCLPDLPIRPPLSRAGYDLDLIVPSDGLRIARQVADTLGGAFYALDPVRDIGRIVFRFSSASKQCVVDVASFQAATLMDDLTGRDFSINAMAVEITRQPFTLIDPVGGLDDLRAGRLRAVSDHAMLQDPVRAVRAVRFRAQFGFEIEPHTLHLAQAASGELTSISVERIRDELTKILALPGVADSLRLMDYLSILSVILPELTPLKGLEQPYRDVDGFEHTLQVVTALESLLPLDGAPPDARLPFREQILDHLAVCTTGGYSRRLLLTIAALLHDIGKPATFGREADGQIHYIGHEIVGARLAVEAMERLRLSAQAVHWVETIVRQHLRPSLLAKEATLSRRAIHRFYRDVGEAGVDTAIVSLADHLGWADTEVCPYTNHDTLLATVTRLFEAYFARRGEIVSPPALLSGDDLVERFGLRPGPAIGELLRELQTAQAAGEVLTRAQAEAWVKRHLTFDAAAQAG
jgi:poly(A) polymerase